jgi:hypothetical protein
MIAAFGARVAQADEQFERAKHPAGKSIGEK